MGKHWKKFGGYHMLPNYCHGMLNRDRHGMLNRDRHRMLNRDRHRMLNRDHHGMLNREVVIIAVKCKGGLHGHDEHHHHKHRFPGKRFKGLGFHKHHFKKHLFLGSGFNEHRGQCSWKNHDKRKFKHGKHGHGRGFWRLGQDECVPDSQNNPVINEQQEQTETSVADGMESSTSEDGNSIWILSEDECPRDVENNQGTDEQQGRFKGLGIHKRHFARRHFRGHGFKKQHGHCSSRDHDKRKNKDGKKKHGRRGFWIFNQEECLSDLESSKSENGEQRKASVDDGMGSTTSEDENGIWILGPEECFADMENNQSTSEQQEQTVTPVADGTEASTSKE